MYLQYMVFVACYQDESDEMLSRGFKDQIYDVYRYLPPELQVYSLCIYLTYIDVGLPVHLPICF